jgi:chain length determinant protein EpsF
MTFEQFFLILRARWMRALGVFAGVVILATVLSIIWPPQYTATTSVVIDSKTDPVTSVLGGAYSEQLLASYVTTQADVIASERVAQLVVKSIHLDRDPELQEKWHSSTDGRGDIVTWLADYLLDKKLTVKAAQSATRASNVIEIDVRWSDGPTAAALANAFAKSAIVTNIELKVAPAKEYAAWFEQRSRDLRADLAIKQKRLSDFQNANGIVATDEKLDVENARLAELSTQMVAIEGQRLDSQSRQRQLSGDNASIPEVLQSPVIGSLKKDLADSQARQADIAARLGKNHPDYIAANAEVKGISERIEQEITKIATSLGKTSQVDLRREGEIRAALEAQKMRVMELKHRHDEASVLESEVQSAQRDLDAVNQRLAQSSLEGQAQQTNIVQLTEAAVPIKPSSPKLLLNVALAMIMGFGLGILAAMHAESRDPRIRSDRELNDLLGVPVLGKIPHVKLSNGRHAGQLSAAKRLKATTAGDTQLKASAT